MGPSSTTYGPAGKKKREATNPSGRRHSAINHRSSGTRETPRRRLFFFSPFGFLIGNNERLVVRPRFDWTRSDKDRHRRLSVSIAINRQGPRNDRNFFFFSSRRETVQPVQNTPNLGYSQLNQEKTTKHNFNKTV